MPSEKVHTYATLIVSVALLPFSPEAAGGALVGLVVDPDLDQSRAGGRRRVRLTLGGAWADAWGWLWEPYDRLTKHRGLSHLPVIGTVGRLLYLAGGFWLALLLARMENWRRVSLAPIGIAGMALFWLAAWAGWTVVGWRGLAEAAIGLAISDLAHVLMDLERTWWKSLWRSR